MTQTITALIMALQGIDPTALITLNLPGALTMVLAASDLDAALGVHISKVLYIAHTFTSVNLRDKPTVLGALLRTMPINTPLSVYTPIASAVLADNHHWVYVRTNDGALGWCAADYLVDDSGKVLIASPPPIAGNPPKKHRIGLHVLSDGVAAASQFVSDAHPPSVTVVDALDFANWCVTKGVQYVIYRSVQTANGDDVHIPEDDPATSYAAGRQVVVDRWARFAGLRKDVFIQITNEQGWNPGHNAFWLGVMAECESRGYRAAIGCYGVGYPEPAQWVELTEALTHAKQHGHIVVLHAYGAPDAHPGQMSPIGEQPYFDERFPRFYAAVQPEARPPLVIAEYEGEFSRGKFQGTENLIHLVGLYEAANAALEWLVSVNLWTAGHNGDGPGNWIDACIDSALPALATWLNR